MTPDEGGSRRRFALVALVFGVVFLAQAVVLVLAFYPAPHNGGDNAGYLTLAHSLLERGAYLELWDPEEPPHTKYPPVFPLILAFAMVLGASSWTAFKAVSLAFASAAVLLTFAWARERRGLAFAAGVSLLFALSDALLWSASWILSDPPFLAFTLLALWSFERAGRWPTSPTALAPPTSPSSSRGPAPEFGHSVWLWIGCAAALLAYFTRSAGIPLVVAVALWMAGHRRWRPLALWMAAFGIPAFLWWMRSRLVGDVTYVAEFWMINPYDPGAGRAGIADLGVRVLRNVHLYVGLYIPQGVVGARVPMLTMAGYLFFLAAAGGWLRRFLRRITVAELFVPIYFGLILLWPEVWSGDRFALPLYPLLLFYSGDLLLDGARAALRTLGGNASGGWRARLGGRPFGRRAGLAIGALLFALVALPALLGWSRAVEHASHCAAVQDLLEGDPFACYPGPTAEFVAAARWSGENLPDDAVVFSRKPRLFYALSGLKSRMYPMTGDPADFSTAAEEGGAQYLLFDRMDNVGTRWLLPVLLERPDAFCGIMSWGRQEDVMTELLGITPGRASDGVGTAAGAATEGTVELSIAPCGPEFVRDVPLPPALPLESVPLLMRDPRPAAPGSGGTRGTSSQPLQSSPRP